MIRFVRTVGWRDGLAFCVGIALIVLHVHASGRWSGLLNPWLIGSLLAGRLVARVALDRIDRSCPPRAPEEESR